MSEYLVEVEEARSAADGKPSAGPVYRSSYAKDGLLEIPAGFESPWDFFRYGAALTILQLYCMHK